MAPACQSTVRTARQVCCAMALSVSPAAGRHSTRLRQTPDATTRPRTRASDRGDGQSSAHRVGAHRLEAEKPATTTVAPESFRGREQSAVSTPIAWDELRACCRARQFVLTSVDVLDRGDVLAPLHGSRAARLELQSGHMSGRLGVSPARR
ncbi:hypothetical protein [Amycolatopsis sp. NPDC051372]|uniref:non-homologous end-joining DNA ligase LigD n=1 Tax=Amycolatopsis sp. NPDC051372 TaxID=3155669 RepID=UPI00342455A8